MRVFKVISAHALILLTIFFPQFLRAEEFLVACEGERVAYTLADTSSSIFFGQKTSKIVYEEGALKIIDEQGRLTLIGREPDDMRCHDQNARFCEITKCAVSQSGSETAQNIESNCSTASKFSGVCAFSDDNDTFATLLSRGFKACTTEPFTSSIVVCSAEDGREISIWPNQIIFNCSNFNTCSYSVRELGQLVVDQRLAESLEVDYLDSEGTITEQYCGRGLAGEKICVREDTYTHEAILVLYKANAAVTPTFD